MTIDKFLDERYTQSALYQSFRSIGSVIDGLKPSSRKILYTVIKLNVNEPTKVSRLAPRASDVTEYLHGESSLEEVIVNMARDFPGSNNINLLKPEGSFGSRFVKEASASRYIFTSASPMLRKLFSKQDDPILIQQEFEGTVVEPKFFVPVLPVILINGSEGIGNGFAQKILSRNPEDLKKAINEIITAGNCTTPLTPWYKGFKGTVSGSGSSWIIRGVFERKNTNTIIVKEIPLSYNLASYRKVLEDLSEAKVIKDYEDKSENDEFLFEIDVTREFSSHTDEWIYKTLKLESSQNENYTCIDKDNKIIVFPSVEELLTYYVTVRLEYYVRRKSAQLTAFQREINIASAKLLFIKSVIEGTVVVNNKKKAEIEEQLSSKLFFKLDDSYDYLLNMPIYSLTEERYKELQKKVDELNKQMKAYSKLTEKDLWDADIKEI
jgi:DNA topoisomerase-2